MRGGEGGGRRIVALILMRIAMYGCSRSIYYTDTADECGIRILYVRGGVRYDDRIVTIVHHESRLVPSRVSGSIDHTPPYIENLKIRYHGEVRPYSWD